MTESKSQDKFFPYPLKQEGFENFNWTPVENDYNDFINSNSFLLGKYNTKNQPFNEFNPLSVNQDLNNDPNSLLTQNENQNTSNDPVDTSGRMNTNYPIFNEKLLANNSMNSDIGINSIKPAYSSLVMNGINKLQSYQMPNNYYFPFTNNNLRRPLPQELLEEEPVYVNPKQYERIMKLRIKKAQRGMIKSSVMPLERPKDKSYKHLSRHLHAKKRVRGAGGRFLSKEAQQKLNEELGLEHNLDQNDVEQIGEHTDNGEFQPIGDTQNFDTLTKIQNGDV